MPDSDTRQDGLLTAATPDIRRILERALAAEEIGRDDGTRLFETSGADLDAVVFVADAIRKARVGDRVTFATVRNINFTNVCYMACQFCNFGVRRDAAGAEWLGLEEVARRAQEAWQRGATEVCIQGGLHPDLPKTYYLDLLRAVKAQVPDIHIHAFSPFEIWYGYRKAAMPLHDYLRALRDAGLGSVPGTAAEIFDREIRLQLTRNKLTADEWETIIRAAHAEGLRSTATMMYGHIDGPRHWSGHICRLRDIQKDTGGFTEFVPLGFVHEKTRLFRNNPATRPGPTREESMKVHAVARILLQGWIDNIQVSWVKLGPQSALEMLNSGANDLGGTLMNESISRAAGAGHGQEITPLEMVRLIRAAGRIPVQRSTLYTTVQDYRNHDPAGVAPMVTRAQGVDPLGFLAQTEGMR